MDDLEKFIELYVNNQSINVSENSEHVDKLQCLITNAMLIWIIRKNMSKEEIELFINKSIKKIKLNSMKQFKQISDEVNMVEKFREDVVLVMNDNTNKVEENLRTLLL